MVATKGAKGSVGPDHVGLFPCITFSWIFPLLTTARSRPLDEDDINPYLGHEDTMEVLSSGFEENLKSAEPSKENLGPLFFTPFRTRLMRTILKTHKRTLMLHAFWALMESTCRVAATVLLRQFLIVFGKDGDLDDDETVRMWVYIVLFGLSQVALAVVHHQLFWKGMRTGFWVRQQAMAAVHSKVLRLNGSSISRVTTGKVVNLVSNDVRRFDDAWPFWVFLWCSPLELAVVFALLVAEVGWLPAAAGISSMLLLIPLQASLVKYSSAKRSATAVLTDKRVQTTSEVVAGALAVKMYGWEEAFWSAITGIRKEEAANIKFMARIHALNQGVFFASAPVVAFVLFSVLYSTGGDLELPTVFYSLALLHLPKLFMAVFFTRAMGSFTELCVSVRRIDKFLSLPEPKPAATRAARAAPSDAPPPSPSADADGAGGGAGAGREAGVEFRGASYSWAPRAEPALSGIELKVGESELLGVTGEVGSGKSSLLLALLGELHTPEAEADRGAIVRGGAAYCAQVPWVVADTLRNNVLFGESMDADRYARVLEACALEQDIEDLQGGDQVELGERGINLSGGQKARVALARAAYSRSAAVHLLDDPLSAVDPRVGRRLFEDCICGLMAGTTRVLVTHQRQYLPRCDRVLVLRGGRVAALGPYEDIAGTVDELPEALGEDEVDLEMLPESASSTSLVGLASAASNSGPSADTNGTKPKPLPAQSCSVKEFSRGQALAAKAGAGSAAGTAAQRGGILVEAEKREVGRVQGKVYAAYARYMGLGWVAVIAALLVGGQAIALGAEAWLSQWSRADPDDQDNSSWVFIYSMLTLSVVVVSLVRAQLFFHHYTEAATRLHDVMLRRVLRSPLSFFHTNPLGRILNRFSKDQGNTDEVLSLTAFDALQCAVMVTGAFTIVLVALPWIVPLMVPLYFAFARVRGKYLITSREVKRIDATTRSPVYASFSATLRGLTTIRAYGSEARFRQEFVQQLELNGSWWFAFIATARWVGFRLDIIASFVCLCSAVIAGASRGFANTSLVALALAWTLQLAGMLQWTVRQSAEVENNMTSVERMVDYATNLVQEPPTVAEGGKPPPKGWPSGTGAVEARRMSATYRDGLPPVLRSVSFSIPAGKSCAIVGRTGSGKSSLLLALYRMISVTEGQVLIDGVDVSTIGVDSLRRVLAVIPQDPVLFSRSVRFNLDPWGKQTDEALWGVLRSVQLDGKIGALEDPMSEHGDNLSVGQRQLLCLARALLQGARVLCLDEATANVDNQTDALIQAAIRGKDPGGGGGPGVGSRTTLVIAHRLDTIADCDHAVVLASGEVVEQGAPVELEGVEGGVYAGMRAAQREAMARSASKASLRSLAGASTPGESPARH